MPSTTAFNISLNNLAESMPDVAHIELRRETEELGEHSVMGANRSRVPIFIRNIVEFTLRNQRDLPNPDDLQRMAVEVARYVPGLAHAMRNGSDLRVINTSISTESLGDVVVTCEIQQQGHRVSVRGHSDEEADERTSAQRMADAGRRALASETPDQRVMREANAERYRQRMAQEERATESARAVREGMNGVARHNEAQEQELTLREIFERCGVDRNIYERDEA